MVDVFTHHLTSLNHLHERWGQFIHDRIYKPEGTVLTLGTLKNYPIFNEFIGQGTSVMKLYRPGCERVNDWATLCRPGIGSDWHQHQSCDWVLVYYPQAQEGELLVGRQLNPGVQKFVTDKVIEPEEGLCVMFRGSTFHKIQPNPSSENRYSMVLMFKEK